MSDLERSRTLYREPPQPLGFTEHAPWQDGVREVTFGLEGAADFAISLEYPTGSAVHVAFAAEAREQVDAFHRAALAAGGRDNGRPEPRPEYSEHYYGAFVLDPDGNCVEAATTRHSR
ncbi:MAG TPA: VOC family protein [Solirubrobacteraceae bacterium]|nr:VOC family protein [Solirubrobacteraceae bacterium]